MHMCICKAS